MNNIYYLFSVKDKCFTDLSVVLKKKNVFKAYYGLAYARKKFLNNDVFDHISYVSDILSRKGDPDLSYLKHIEHQYDVNLAIMIHADRHLLRYKKDKRLFLAQELVKQFIGDMEKYQIGIVIAEAVDDFISYFASYYCKKHNIPFFFATYIGYGDQACLSSNIDSEPNEFRDEFRKSYDLIKQNKVDVSSVEKGIIKYIESRKKPTYFTLGNPDYKSFRWIDIKIFFNYIKSYFLDRNGMHYDKFPLLTPFYRLVRIARKNRYRAFLKQHSVTPADLDNLNYLIYPLHFEPEASTLIQGRWFNDQIKIIELISKNLPVDITLVVKEHKASIGRRPLSFYKNIVKHHNVKLVDDTIDSYRFVEKSKGVAVISSTMGLEALMLKKPVMAFGERFYHVSNNVYEVNKYKEIRSMVEKMLNHQFDWLDTLATFHTILVTTKNLGCLSHEEYNENDLEIMANEVIGLFNAAKNAKTLAVA